MTIPKKSYAALAAAVSLMSGIAAAGEANFLTELADGHRQKIVVYGTSLTANSAWPAELQTALRQAYRSKAEVVNAAGGGKDSRWGLRNLEKRVIRERPDTVFIEFTINDALITSHLGVSESMSNLEQMIETIREKRPYCDVIVMIMNPPTGEALEQRPQIREYESGYRRVAERTHCRIIDFSRTWRNLVTRSPQLWQSYAPDGLHPNSAAAREVILPYLFRKIGFHPPTPATPVDHD